jgi:hypothetical protein
MDSFRVDDPGVLHSALASHTNCESADNREINTKDVHAPLLSRKVSRMSSMSPRDSLIQ